MIRFIHAADLHLDTPFLGLEQVSTYLSTVMQIAPFQSFQRIVDKAIERKVDFVLLAGDLYNTQKINIKAQNLFIAQLNRLNQEEIPVFLIRGNHDYLAEETRTLTLPLPDNVYTYTDKVSTHVIKTKKNKKVAITGFSYESQWVHDRKIKDYPLRKENIDMHIGMLHGAVEHASSIRGNYAPFTLEELGSKNYDYWALGHIHQKQQISTHPLVIYPGNIQGLHKNETGEKGCLLVEWSERGEEIEFIPTASVVWEKLRIKLAGIKNIVQLIDLIHGEIIEKGMTPNRLIHLIVEVSKEDDEELIAFIQTREFPVQFSNQLNLPNVWLVQTEVIVNKISDQQSLEKLYPNEWLNSVESTRKLSIFNEISEDILNNIPRKYLIEKNTKQYRKKMIEKAIAKIYLK